MIPRDYQEKSVDDLWDWFGRHPEGNAIMDMCVGAGKSLVIAMIAKRAIQQFPATRIIVIAHQKELCQQNLDKLMRVWPEADVGVYSAAMGQKSIGKQITYATIGSIYKQAHLMGSVQLILCDECHLINTKEAGMWRKFIADMRAYGNPDLRIVGFTGTPFRNGGVWITAGDDPLFHGIAAKVSMTELLERGYLAPLVPVNTSTRIDTSDVGVAAGDYIVSELARAADKHEIVVAACREIVQLAANRKRWLVFAVNVEHAIHVRDELRSHGVSVDVITGETPKVMRESLLAGYARGEIRCLVSIGVLTTGFDQPDIDFIALLRATKSPTLAIQMCGRGMRLADGKVDCAFADFTDTIANLGPIDKITGRLPTGGRKGEAPHKLCPSCGSQNPASATECMDCGFQFPPPERIKHGAQASAAAVLSSQRETMFETVPVTEVRYKLHEKPGSPPSLRVEYYDGLLKKASEWVCVGHQGFARTKAERWWQQRSKIDAIPGSAQEALEWIEYSDAILRKPEAIIVTKAEKYPSIVSYHWQKEQA